MNVSHLGLRVRDLPKVQRFYEALGFREMNRLTVPDKLAGALLGLEPPIGFEAVYLDNDASCCNCSRSPGIRHRRSRNGRWSERG